MTTTGNAAANVAAYGQHFTEHDGLRLLYALHGHVPYDEAARPRGGHVRLRYRHRDPHALRDVVPTPWSRRRRRARHTRRSAPGAAHVLPASRRNRHYRTGSGHPSTSYAARSSKATRAGWAARTRLRPPPMADVAKVAPMTREHDAPGSGDSRNITCTPPGIDWTAQACLGSGWSQTSARKGRDYVSIVTHPLDARRVVVPPPRDVRRTPALVSLDTPLLPRLHRHQASRSLQEGSHCGHLGVRFHLVTEVAKKIHADSRVQTLGQLDRFYTPVGSCI